MRFFKRKKRQQIIRHIPPVDKGTIVINNIKCDVCGAKGNGDYYLSQTTENTVTVCEYCHSWVTHDQYVKNEYGIIKFVIPALSKDSFAYIAHKSKSGITISINQK